jgi:hypothetical protein
MEGLMGGNEKLVIEYHKHCYLIVISSHTVRTCDIIYDCVARNPQPAHVG